MADSLDKQVDLLLQEGKSKQAIYSRLKKPDNQAKLVFFLNNKATFARRHTYMWINLFLGIALLGMTLRLLLKTADIISAQGVGLYLLAEFIVPTVNFYILREIFLFHRTGYQFLTILTGLSLVIYPANRAIPDLFINLGMMVLGAFLYLRMFPKDEILHLKKE